MLNEVAVPDEADKQLWSWCIVQTLVHTTDIILSIPHKWLQVQ
jgi:putative heme iron utilization protein